jgi:nicotinamidase-related amidase
MFKSDFSKKVFGGSPAVVVTHKRRKTYEHKIRNKEKNLDYNRSASSWSVKTSEGWEIVKEMRVAPSEVEAVRAKYGDGVFVDEAPAFNS